MAIALLALLAGDLPAGARQACDVRVEDVRSKRISSASPVEAPQQVVHYDRDAL
jgi:hypothetical protein